MCEEITCPYCKNKKSRKVGFDNYGLQRYYCKCCGKKFTKNTEKRIKIACPKCSSLSIKRVGKTNTGMQKYFCKDCHSWFSEHKVKAKIKEVCPDCGGTHIIRNGFSKSGYQVYLCDTCGRKFISAKDKYQHKECPECKHPYARKCGTVRGEQYYECLSCHRKFKDNYKVRILSQADIRNIRRALYDGSTRLELAEQYNVSKRLIMEHTKDIKTLADSKREFIDAALNVGWAIPKTAEVYGVSEGYVRKRAYALMYRNSLTRDEIASIITYGKTFNVTVDRIIKYVPSNVRNKVIVQELYRAELEKSR